MIGCRIGIALILVCSCSLLGEDDWKHPDSIEMAVTETRQRLSEIRQRLARENSERAAENEDRKFLEENGRIIKSISGVLTTSDMSHPASGIPFYELRNFRNQAAAQSLRQFLKRKSENPELIRDQRVKVDPGILSTIQDASREVVFSSWIYEKVIYLLPQGSSSPGS